MSLRHDRPACMQPTPLAQSVANALVLAIRYLPYFIEIFALAVIAQRVPALAFFDRAARAFSRLARRRGLAVLVTAAAALVLRAALLPVLPTRQPVVTDEFSYLLAADTFASGRAANPTHPMWQHFETIHVLQHPARASMYHVAQGLVLASGKLVFGHPWAGVWASVILMSALLTWMLQDWVPPRWALLGGLLGVLRLGLYSYWVDSYWGGAAAAIGGLLLLGAMPRWLRRPQTRWAVVMALGLAVLANSRPYEGFVLTLAVALSIMMWLRRRPSPFRLAARLTVPIVLVLAPCAVGMGYYYFRVTGSPLRMPYQEDRDQYAPARIFVWERPHAIPEYRHAALRDFYVGWELRKFLDAKTPTGFLRDTVGKAGAFWMFFLGPALTLPLLYGRRLFRDRRIRPLLVIGAVSAVGLSMDVWFYPHYAAPLLGVTYALVLQGMRHLRANGVRAVVLACLAMTVLRAAAQPLAFYMPPDWPMTWYYTRPGNTARAAVEDQLRHRPGRHLVLVHYRPGHDALEEWVYNAAAIDQAPIVWAREMDPIRNRELRDYFKSRRVWLIDPDAATLVELTP